MKGVNVIVVLFIVAVSELARASESYDYDSFEEVPNEVTFDLKRWTRPKRTSTKSYYTQTERTGTTAAEYNYDESTPDHSTTANPTTSAPTTTTPQPHCHGSKFTVSDLKVIIKHAANESKVFESIKASYHEDALKIIEDFNKTLAIFSEWFVEQPGHLKHILEDLSQRHKLTQLYIDEITKDLKDNAVALQEFKNLQAYVLSLERMTDKTKMFCEYSCQSQPLSKYFMYESVQEDSDDDYYCDEPVKEDSADDHYCGDVIYIYGRVRDNLNKFTTQTEEELKTLLDKDISETNIKIKGLENKLKDIALNKFGRTMYDILNLIDAYHHLEKKSRVHEVHALVVRNKKDFTDLKSNSWRLNDQNKQIVEKCKTCRPKHYNALGSLQTEEKQDLLTKLIDEHENEIKREIMDDYNNIFKGLRDNLNLDNPEIVEKYLENLKKIQEEVNVLTKNEHDTFAKLSQEFPKKSIEEQELIENEMGELIKFIHGIEKELNDIERNIPKM